MLPRKRSAALGLLALLAIAGCGGSSSSGSASDAVTSASVAAGQSAQHFVALRSLADMGNIPTLPADGSLQFNEQLGLFYRVVVVNATTYRVDFFTSADGTGDGGTVLLTVTSTSPVVVHETFDVTTHGTRISGDSDVTLDGDEVAIVVAGSYASTNPASHGTFDLNLSDNSAVTGNLSVTAHGRTVAFTHIASTPDGAFSADYATTEATGHVQRNLDGSGSVSANSSQGVFTLTWTANQLATLHFPNGSTKDLGTLSSL